MDDRLPTPELLTRARAGDRASVQELLERYHRRLAQRIRLLMGDGARRQAESADFVQALCVDLLGMPQQIGGGDERAFLRWATAVARNNLRDHLRRPREQAFESLSSTVFGRSGAAPSAHSPLSGLVAEERLELLLETLESLPLDQREVIALRDLDGLDYSAVGTRLNCSPDAARMRHVRATLELGEALRRKLGAE